MFYFDIGFYFLLWYDFDIANYADDSTPHCAGKSAELIVNNLEQLSRILFEWLNNNHMKVNTGKRHPYFQVILELRLRLTIVILNWKMKVLLGITTGSNLIF